MGKLGLGCVVLLVVLAVIVGISMAGTYNRLVRLDQAVDKQWGQVENVYQRRADLVPNLVATVRGAAEFEKSTLEAVVNARASVGRAQVSVPTAPTDPAAMASFEAAQASLGAALQRLLVVVERYPELRANQNFRDLQAQLEGTENRIAVERMRYNDSAQEYNTARRSFPTNLFASMFGFREKAYFKATAPGAERAPAVQFDFKNPAPAATP